MTETPQPEVAPATRETDNPRVLFAVQMVLLAATVALCLLTAGAPFTQWKLAALGLLTLLSVLSELTSAKLPSGVVDISGSFLAIMLAAVLLGGTPAAIVGALTIGIGWFSTRERG